MLNRLRLQLSLSLFIGSLALGLLAGLPPLAWLIASFHSVTNPQTLILAAIIGLILVMSRLMEDSGHMKRLVESFALLSRDARVVSSAMPALIGLLPMPGGALFSAPLVETSFQERPVSREEKTVLNYWFRHVWEYWWPLYPGVVLAIALLEVDASRFMIFMAPLTLISLLVGSIFILRPLGSMSIHHDSPKTWPEVRRFLFEMMPILIVIFVIIIIGVLRKVLGLFDVHFRMIGGTAILPGLLAAVTWVCVVNQIPLKRLKQAVTAKGILTLVLLIFAIMIFRGIMMESQIVAEIRDELTAYKIPVLIVIMLMPFVSGIVTGIAIGFVGTSFPLIIPLFDKAQQVDYMFFTALAFTFGYMGMMLSPVHLCLLVSKDYYKASLMKSYRYLVPPVVAVLVIVVALFFVIRYLLRYLAV
jgi:integral membrane protein (TIGR00529 family)